ncbi:MAG: restriction endonuclease [Bacillaceae bacterium]|nr:restriction endonuclease [Bacillaceae bacterium]
MNDMILYTLIAAGVVVLGAGFYLFWRRRKRQEVDAYPAQLPDRQVFLEQVIAVFKQLGYHIENPKEVCDYGADFIMRKGPSSFVVRTRVCKTQTLTGEEEKAGMQVVQEAAAARPLYKTALSLVICDGYFTTDAERLAQANRVMMWDRDIWLKQWTELEKAETDLPPEEKQPPLDLLQEMLEEEIPSNLLSDEERKIRDQIMLETKRLMEQRKLEKAQKNLANKRTN